jgi:hypothetical protein
MTLVPEGLQKDKYNMDFPSFEGRAQEQKLLRIGFVGCGHIAEHHIRFVHETRNAKVVGLAD